MKLSEELGFGASGSQESACRESYAARKRNWGGLLGENSFSLNRFKWVDHTSRRLLSAHNSSDLLLVLNVLFSVFNSLHSVTMIKYCASHDFIYNTLNIIKILFIAFKSNRKVCLRCINLRLNRHPHQQPPKIANQHLSLTYFDVQRNLVQRYQPSPLKPNPTPISQPALKICNSQASDSLYSTIIKCPWVIFLLNSYLTWVRRLWTRTIKREM